MQKSRVLKALQANCHTVGFLGDDINDAAALRDADVGISVDSGTDISKESADIIPLEKSLMVLEEGVLKGRETFGSISKRQSVTDFHFSRLGGTCPLWNVYEAFAQPGRVLTQVAQMPDGCTYLWVAHTVGSGNAGYGMPAKTFAVGIGCDIRHASRLVYSRGLDLNDPGIATPYPVA